jgi:thiol-disulfide isomerase/thioredoxin
MKSSTKYLLIALFVGIVALVYLNNRSCSEGFADGSTPSFTMYYASWCPHCKDVKPVFEQWMMKNKSQLTVNGKPVNLHLVEESSKKDDAPVKGYPTFLLNKDGKYTEFNGSRDSSGWEKWLSSNV